MYVFLGGFRLKWNIYFVQNGKNKRKQDGKTIIVDKKFHMMYNQINKS